MEKRFKIDFSSQCAIEEIITPLGNKHTKRFLIFSDFKGLKIFTRNGVEYLTQANSEVLWLNVKSLAKTAKKGLYLKLVNILVKGGQNTKKN